MNNKIPISGTKYNRLVYFVLPQIVVNTFYLALTLMKKIGVNTLSNWDIYVLLCSNVFPYVFFIISLIYILFKLAVIYKDKNNQLFINEKPFSINDIVSIYPKKGYFTEDGHKYKMYSISITLMSGDIYEKYITYTFDVINKYNAFNLLTFGIIKSNVVNELYKLGMNSNCVHNEVLVEEY